MAGIMRGCPDCNNTGTIPVTIANPAGNPPYSESCPCTYGGAK